MKRITAFPFICLALLIIACPQVEEEPRIISVTASPQNKTVPTGLTQQFTAVVDARGGAEKTIRWELEDNTHAGTVIDANTGLLTVHEDETSSAPTFLRIKAVSADPRITPPVESEVVTVKVVKTVHLTKSDFKTSMQAVDSTGEPVKYFLLTEDVNDDLITLNNPGASIVLFGKENVKITGKLASSGVIIVENDAELTLENITIAADTSSAKTSSFALIRVNAGGKLVINDGVTLSNTLPAPVAGDSETDTGGGNGAGSGVIIFGGTVTMNGGTFINNASHAVRFAVDEPKGASTKGTFTMNGGNITGSAGANAQAHGVVIAGDDNHVIMTGGTISNYSAQNRTGMRFVEDTKNCSFTMKGGAIKDNSMGIRLVTNGDRSKWTEKCSIVMEGGLLENNATYAIRGGGVHDFKFTKTGGEIKIVGTNGILIRSTDDSSNLARRRSPVPADEDLTLVISSSGTEVVSMSGKWN